MAQRLLTSLRNMSDLFRLVGTLHRALDYHSSRHGVLASNIANVDTPGFRPQELLRGEEASPGRPARLTRTDEAHLTVTGADPDDEDLRAVEDRTARPGPDGNAVSLDREMSKLAVNDLRYEAAARMVSKQIALLRYTVNDGQG